MIDSAIKYLAFTFGIIVTIYSFGGFVKMKKWKKVTLIISVIIAWITGLWVINTEDLRATKAENNNKVIMHNDSLFIKRQDSISTITCKNTASLLLHKNDSLKSIINYYKSTISQKGNSNNATNNPD
jgi:hypothetical protein